MSLKKIVIDLPIVLDPHKLLILLGGLDRTHEEILVPDILKYIEVWTPPGGDLSLPPMTLRVFEQELDEGLDRFFGFDKRRISPENFCAGIRLLRYAYDHGMISLIDSAHYTKRGQEVLQTDKLYPPFYRQQLPSGHTVNLNPDAPLALESLIGVEEELGAVPVFGDLAFLDYVNDKRPEARIREHEGQLTVDSQTAILLDCPKVVTFDELIWFVSNRAMFNAVSDKLKFGSDWRLTRKDIGLMGLKFGGTLTTDVVLFGGLPVTSGGLFAYELVSRVVRVVAGKDKKS